MSPSCNVDGSGVIIRFRPSNLKLSFTTTNPDVFNIGFIYIAASSSALISSDVPVTNESM